MVSRRLLQHRPGTPLYPWDRWFTQRKLRLVRNIDYRCQPHSMAQQVRTAAGARGYHVSVRIEGDVITVEVD